MHRGGPVEEQAWPGLRQNASARRSPPSASASDTILSA